MDLGVDFLLVIQIIGFQNELCILEPIIFCITNEIPFRIISLSSDHKFFLECWFSIRNYLGLPLVNFLIYGNRQEIPGKVNGC